MSRVFNARLPAASQAIVRDVAARMGAGMAEFVEAEVDEVKLTGRKRKAVKAFLRRLVGKKEAVA